MKKTNNLIITFSFLLLLLLFNVKIVNAVQVQEINVSYSDAVVKVVSDKKIKEIRMYKLFNNDEYRICYKAVVDNKNEYTIKISKYKLSEESETRFKIVVIDEDGETSSEGFAVDKLQPRPTSKPTPTSNANASTKPAASPSSSTSSSTSPTTSPKSTPTSKPKDDILTTAFDSYSFATVGKTVALKPKSSSGKKLTYSTSNKKVATIDSKGIITAKGTGTAKITVKENGGKSKTVTVRVPKINTREQALQPWYNAMKAQRDATVNSKYNWIGSQQTIEGSKKQGTCITFPSVSLQRAGLLNSGEYLTAQNGSTFSSGLKNYSKKVIKKHSKYLEYIDLGSSGKTAKQLGNKLLRGDIVNYKTHTQVYMGKNSKGVRLYNTAGRICGPHSNKAKLNHATTGYDNKPIGVIFRIKTYNVNASCTNGTVSGSNQYMAGQNATITYKAGNGKKLKSVTVDGKKINIKKHPTSYTFKDLKSNHDISIVYE